MSKIIVSDSIPYDRAPVYRRAASPPYTPPYSWIGLGAPKNTPAEIIDKLNTEVNAGIIRPALKARLSDFGGAPLVGSAVDFGKLIAEETEKWGKVIRAANIKL
jgi:tripartite-type tricarboxylate transporter receptor subunit TctC